MLSEFKSFYVLHKLGKKKVNMMKQKVVTLKKLIYKENSMS